MRAIEAERFRLDGGAMHGVVPKTLWAKVAPPDEQNRVEYTTRCLLLEGHGRRILVETGNGDKWSPREREIFAIEPGAGIARRLRAAGVEPGSIDTVVTTHLHFDHIGGATFRDEGGAPRPTFPRARHLTQRQELHDAFHPHERNRASYLDENLRPLADAGLFDELDGEREIANGVRVVPTPGHTPGHQSLLIEGDGARLFFCGDLMPTSAHLRLPWVMAYDVLPVTTLETKRAMVERAIREGWILVWGHDLNLAGGRVTRDAKGNPKVAEPVSF
ncbi:MAG: MBL fold metallo-hydrolase [Myxococcota bacterium]